MSIQSRRNPLRRIATTALVAVGATAAVAAVGATPAHAEQSDNYQSDNFRVSAYQVDSTRAATTYRVQVCAKNVAPGETVRVSWDAWEMHFQDGSTESPVASFGPGEQQVTTYPEEGDGYEAFLSQNDCARGDLVFPVTGRMPDGVTYTSSLGDVAHF